MATLYVENVPDEVYDAVKLRAKENRSSIAAEIVSVLKTNFPTKAELRRRQQALEKLTLMAASAKVGGRAHLSTTHKSSEEMQREDRER